MGMFEVNIFTPGKLVPTSSLPETNTYKEQFGAFVPWLVINRGPLSALIHPNTDEAERDHTQRATWMGQPLPLNLRMFKQT
jgi:aromatic ring-cleaving dioxygenase